MVILLLPIGSFMTTTIAILSVCKMAEPGQAESALGHDTEAPAEEADSVR